VPPRNDIERVMAEIWQHVLGLDKVGILDDFSQMGGGSLQSLRIISQMADQGITLKEESGSTELRPELLFQHTTISELSPHLQFRQHEGAS